MNRSTWRPLVALIERACPNLSAEIRYAEHKRLERLMCEGCRRNLPSILHGGMRPVWTHGEEYCAASPIRGR